MRQLLLIDESKWYINGNFVITMRVDENTGDQTIDLKYC